MTPTPAPPCPCVVLVPPGDSGTGHAGEDALRELERRGYPVWRDRGRANPGDARSRLASDALAAGFGELFWIDPDMAFDPNDVGRLRGLGLPLVGGLCPDAGGAGLGCEFAPGTASVRLGAGGGPVGVPQLGLGFALVRRAVFEAVARVWRLPECGGSGGTPLVPYFAPMAVGGGAGGFRYLGPDDAFCERARRCGVAAVADTAVRLWRVGPYRYGWEDAGGALARSAGYTLMVAGEPPAVPPAAPCPPADARPPLRGPAAPLPAGFPRLRAYVVTYPANAESLDLTLADFARCDWGEPPTVVTQPAGVPVGRAAGAETYRRALERAAEDGCDFALLLEDDVRVNRHLRRNLLANELVRRDACDYLGLFLPDLIASPWERREPQLGYRVAKPLYAGPNRLWEKHRVWGCQAVLLSARLVRACLERWGDLNESQDSRLVAVCGERGVPLYYAEPCLAEHAPLRSAFGTPAAYAPDFEADFELGPAAGFRPPDGVPGRLTAAEGRLLFDQAAGRRVLDLSAGAGAAACLAQSAERVVSVAAGDASEAAEWARRFGVAGRVEFVRGEVGAACRGLPGGFGLAVLDARADAAGLDAAVAGALPLLLPGGRLAFGGYPDPEWPDARRVVDAHARRLGWRRVAQADYLGVFRVGAAGAG